MLRRLVYSDSTASIKVHSGSARCRPYGKTNLSYRLRMRPTCASPEATDLRPEFCPVFFRLPAMPMRRSHAKSRLGCNQCKVRRVKVSPSIASSRRRPSLRVSFCTHRNAAIYCLSSLPRPWSRPPAINDMQYISQNGHPARGSLTSAFCLRLLLDDSN